MALVTARALHSLLLIAARRLWMLPLAFGTPYATQAASWQQTADVIYIDAGSPVPRAEAEAALRYAMASWSARVDLPLRWSDAVAGIGYKAGSIVIRWVDSDELTRTSNNLLSLAATRRWVYPSNGAIAGAEIHLHRAAFTARENPACFTHVVLHELGHALGLSHLPDRNSVMYKDLVSCHHTLTAADITAAPYPQHPCHAELLPDYTIYVPVITVGQRSFASRLRYDGSTWTIAEHSEVPHYPECADTYFVDGSLMLEQLWTPERRWQAELQAEGQHRWSLKFAR